MSTGVVAIFVTENEYAERLMDYLNERAELPFKTVAFTVKEELEKYLENNVIDLLLVTAEEMCKEIEHNIKSVIILSSGTIPKKLNKYATIFKYQSMEKIIREILDRYIEIHNNGEIVTLKNQAKIVAVYSPIGSESKSIFSLVLGQMLAANKKVLYLNLEEFAAFDKLFDMEFSGDLADLMYFFKQNKQMLMVKLQAVVRSVNKLDFVPPITFSEDLRNLDVEQWLSLIEAISISSGYEVIILDVGNMLKDFLAVLEISNLVYLPVDNSHVNKSRIAAFEEYLERVGREKLLNKIKNFEVPYLDDVRWDNEYFEELKWSDLGEKIKELIDDENGV